jgi:hypothetical protein
MEQSRRTQQQALIMTWASVYFVSYFRPVSLNHGESHRKETTLQFWVEHRRID